MASTCRFGGTLATVTERACANPIPTVGLLANLCTNTPQTTNATPLGQFTAHSGDPGQPLLAMFAPNTPTYFFKDIQTETGGGLSTMNESFHAAPEPMSMALLGSGFLCIGLLKRRKSVKST